MDFAEKRHRDALYEKSRLEFSTEYRAILREYGLTYKDVASRLGWTVPQVRRAVQSEDVTFKTLVTLLWALQGTVRITMVIPRP